MAKKKSNIDTQSNLLALKAKLQNQASQLKLGQDIGLENDELFWYGPPVSPKEFIESPEYFDNKHKQRVYPWVIEQMEHIFSGKYFAPSFQVAVFLAGKGSGKSYLAAFINAYTWYWLLSFKNFALYLKQKDNIDWDETTTIHLIGSAPTSGQAKKIVFDTTTKLLNEIKILKDRNWLPSPYIKTELVYNNPNNNMKKIAIAASSSNIISILGFCIFNSVIDESCFWKEKNKDRVEELFTELNVRRFTRFKNNGLITMISSANTDGDFTDSFEDKAAHDPSILFKRISTYDCQPQYFTLPRFELKVKHEKDDGTIEDLTLHPPEILRSFYEDDLDKTLKDFDAIPAVAGRPFYRDFMLIMSKINRERTDPCPDLGIDKPEDPESVWGRLPESFKGIPGANYRIHVDLAKGSMVKGQCGVGFAMCHKIADPNFGYKIVLDLAVRFKAPANKEIQVQDILNFILDLKEKKKFNIDKISFDQWNSLAPRQIINTWNNGIVAEELAVGYKHHIHLKSCISSGQFDWYEDINLLFELKRLEDYGSDCVDHGINSFKDESDAVAGAAYSAAALDATNVKVKEVKPRTTLGMTIGRPERNMNSNVGFYKNDLKSTPIWRQNT